MKYFLVLLITILFILPSSVFAHVLKTDGDIGAILHVDPEDDPIAGQPSGLFFEFKDKQGKFKIENCNCTLSVSKEGKEIYSQPLTDPNVFYTFPEKNVYQIKVIGKPTSTNAFQPFTLTYDVRVARESSSLAGTQNIQQNWFTTNLTYIIVGSIIGIFLLVSLINQLKRR